MTQAMQNHSVVAVDRRSEREVAARALKQELNLEQVAALNVLEQFGWYLKFIRRNPPKPPIAVLCDPDRHQYAILDERGVLHENPVFEKFRHD